MARRPVALSLQKTTCSCSLPELEDVDAGRGGSRHAHASFSGGCGRGVCGPGRRGRGVVTAVTPSVSPHDRPPRITGTASPRGRRGCRSRAGRRRPGARRTSPSPTRRRPRRARATAGWSGRARRARRRSAIARSRTGNRARTPAPRVAAVAGQHDQPAVDLDQRRALGRGPVGGSAPQPQVVERRPGRQRRVEVEEPPRADEADQPLAVAAHQVRVPRGDRGEAVGRQRQLAGVEDVGAAQQVGVRLGERDPQPRRRTPSRARRRRLEVAPRAGRHQPPTVGADEVGGVVAEDARAVGTAEEEVAPRARPRRSRGRSATRWCAPCRRTPDRRTSRSATAASSSRSGRPASSVTNRTSRRPSWPKPPASPPPSG